MWIPINFTIWTKLNVERHWDYPSDKQIILGVGALIHRKGFDLVIKALSTLTQQPKFHNLVFYILGSEGAEGDYRTELKHYVMEHNLQEHVVFQGAVANQQLITLV
ncbi:glycosyltransferase [Psychrosphaera algicola]|uniref:Glycosyltransferase n=1 Tax=Psychrosphaera algicola TaxID=3023714 RepID=A0ABT5FEP7_9GAMM|nr:glycosyltransferase [Psychrosphaera sp. G1-22]MDC2890026.1 glycosyltransferase [Psychrosphaera sp. G1-22]